MSDTLAYEASFWGDCTNTIGEEIKQFTYAQFMGLERSYYSYDVGGRRILDIGGGPVSLLLKTRNLKEGCVIDPIHFPNWVILRYAIRNIRFVEFRGEEITESGWDEVWIYNVLQHVEEPGMVIGNARRAAPVLRLFEWIDIPPYEGHPHMLTKDGLSRWIGHPGEVRDFPEHGGRAFFGVFATT